MTTERASQVHAANRSHFQHWEKIKDCIDQYIDMMLNYRQSGHPGGSRSKVHVLLTTLMGDVMRWDIRHPEKRCNDRFILVAGHTAPLVYATLPVLNEAFREMHRRTGDPKYFIPEDRAVLWEDLLRFRRRGGLAGHAEQEGKTLFFKFNTGPSGHGSPAACGEAMALMRAGLSDVRVYALEGEGGLTAGASHEVKNSAWGLGLENLVYLIDWNDFGIDSHPASSVIHGTPRDWFEPYGWRVTGAENGSNFDEVSAALSELLHGQHPARSPRMCFVKTRKGREYGKFDYKSHGAPHPPNHELYWETKRVFAERYGVDFAGFGQPAPSDPTEWRAQVETNLRKVAEVMHKDDALLEYMTSTLIRLGDSVPTKTQTFRFDTAKNPWQDTELTDFKKYPDAMWAKPGDKQPNRAGFIKWGAWANAWARKKYGRPLFLGLSADLAESTGLAGLGEDFGDLKGWGKYEWQQNPEGVVLPQEITEFTNSGMAVGIATVNLSEKPFDQWDGLGGVCSTYGSFSYLKYGPMRLFSQLAQDSEIQVGKVIWIAGHSGPETADDSRTHFGIYEPYVTQLFPDGHVVDVHPWEMNEVPVVLAAALASGEHIVALHLTRPPVTIPDRAALGIDSHFEAARGAYIIRDYTPGKPRGGTLIVSGTMSTFNTIKLLPELEKNGLNVKIVAAISPQLWKRADRAWRDRVLSEADWFDSTVISNRGRRTMADWMPHQIAAEYAMTSDFDDRWRTGGTLDEVIEEAHLSPEWLLKGIERFVREREARLARLRGMLEGASR
ncbi:MAG: transketolase [Candidatus Eisenbacteria bacterium]